jgi:hypothetical protein
MLQGCRTRQPAYVARRAGTTTLRYKAGSLKLNTALEYSTRVVQKGGRRCKKSTLNDLVHLTPLRIPLMNPPIVNFIPPVRDYEYEANPVGTTTLFFLLCGKICLCQSFIIGDGDVM